MVEKRIMYYPSSQKILLVREGDFSFSLCLARAFGSAANMVAPSSGISNGHLFIDVECEAYLFQSGYLASFALCPTYS
jgi:hypothetical protein